MKDKTKAATSSRRTFLKTSLGAAAAVGFPTIVPSSVFGQLSPSNRINVGAIGVGRISRGHDLPGIWKYDQANIIAVCDLDANRVELGKALINGFYSKKTGKPYDGVTGYHNYREQGHRRCRHQHAGPSARHPRRRRSPRKERRLPAKARVPDHLRGPPHERSGHGLQTNPADRLATTLVEAVLSRLRARSQRPHRRNQARRNRIARRPGRRRSHSDACAPRLPVRRLARLDSRGP